jgi:carboxylesterase type B
MSIQDGKRVGNISFWNQRTALEWIHKNVQYFGENPKNITVGGYSAGGFSAFYQLAYELYHFPVSETTPGRMFTLSNNSGVQLKTLEQQQKLTSTLHGSAFQSISQTRKSLHSFVLSRITDR